MKLGRLHVHRGHPDGGVVLFLSPHEGMVRPFVFRSAAPCAHPGPRGPCGGTREGRREGSDDPWTCRRCGQPGHAP